MTLELDALERAAKKPPFYMRGNFGPVPDEVTAIDLTVEGRVPDALNGVYLRNGPNPSAKQGTPAHWFLGDGMLHGLRLGGGKAQWYRNRWVKTGQLAGQKFMRDDFSMDYRVGASNTHVVPHNGNIYALVESSFPMRMSPELETLGVEDFGGKLNCSFTAHPKLCPETGELHAFGYGFAPPYLVYHRIAADGTYVQREEIAVTGATMIHDFAMTRNHLIFMDLPVVFDIEIAMKGGMPYQFRDDYPARLGILRKGRPASETRWVSVQSCYVFHVANAFETADGTIHLDVARYPEMWRPGTTKNFDAASLWRWSIAPGASAAKETQFDDRRIEFPRTDERKVSLAYRYAYAAMGETMKDEENFTILARYDLETGKSLTQDFGGESLLSEFVAAPKHEGASEKDVWLMGFVFDGRKGSSDFLILDGETLETQAKVILPRRVPQGFHGSWVAD